MTSLTLVVLSFIAISLILAGVSDAKIDETNIMGIWLFDDGKGETAADASKNGNDGKLMEGPKWVDGKFGGALSFDVDEVALFDTAIAADDLVALMSDGLGKVLGLAAVSKTGKLTITWGDLKQ